MEACSFALVTGLPVTAVCCCATGKLLGPLKLPDTNVLGSWCELWSTGIRCALAAAMDRESKLAAAESLYGVWYVERVCMEWIARRGDAPRHQRTWLLRCGITKAVRLSRRERRARGREGRMKSKRERRRRRSGFEWHSRFGEQDWIGRGQRRQRQRW